MAKLHLITYGCQMNEYDSERVAGLLRERALRAHRRCGGGRRDPRQHLRHPREGRGQGLLASSASSSSSRPTTPSLIIGVMGCMAQLQNQAVFRRAPYVDLVFGSPAIARVGELVERARRERRPVLETGEAPLVKITTKAPTAERLRGVRHGHGGVREALHLLRGPAHARPRAQPFARVDRGRGPGPGGRGLPRGHAARPDRQRLRSRSHAGHRPGRAVRSGSTTSPACSASASRPRTPTTSRPS